MKKIEIKTKKIKEKIKNFTGYSRHIARVQDLVTGEEFSVVFWLLRGNSKNMPMIKIDLPTIIGCVDGIKFKENSMLLKNIDGVWSKDTVTSFDKASAKKVGVSSMTEAAVLGSLDIIIIAQVEDLVRSKVRDTLASPYRVTA